MSVETMKLLVAALGEEIEAAQAKPIDKQKPKPRQIGEWCRRDDARDEFGIPPHRLKQLVKERKVKAKKFNLDDPTSVVVFKTADIRKAIEEMPDYLYESGTKDEKGN